MEQDATREEEWVTLAEAASHASVSRRTLYNWISEGKLPHKRTVGGMLRVQKSSLWQDTGKIPE